MKKPVEVEVAGKIPSLTGEFIGETHRALERTQNYPPRNQHQKSPICLWVVEKVTESWQRAEQAEFFPLRHIPIDTATTQPCGLPYPGEHLRLCPLLGNRHTETKKKKMAQMKEQIKAAEKNTTK